MGKGHAQNVQIAACFSRSHWLPTLHQRSSQREAHSGWCSARSARVSYLSRACTSGGQLQKWAAAPAFFTYFKMRIICFTRRWHLNQRPPMMQPSFASAPRERGATCLRNFRGAACLFGSDGLTIFCSPASHRAEAHTLWVIS